MGMAVHSTTVCVSTHLSIRGQEQRSCREALSLLHAVVGISVSAATEDGHGLRVLDITARGPADRAGIKVTSAPPILVIGPSSVIDCVITNMLLTV